MRKEEEGVDENSKSDNAEVSEGEGSLFLVDHFIADEDFGIDDEYGDIDGETECRDESRIVLGEFALNCVGTFSRQFRFVGHSDAEYTQRAESSCRVVDDVGVEGIVRGVMRFDQRCDDCSIRTCKPCLGRRAESSWNSLCVAPSAKYVVATTPINERTKPFRIVFDLTTTGVTSVSSSTSSPSSFLPVVGFDVEASGSAPNNPSSSFQSPA